MSPPKDEAGGRRETKKENAMYVVKPKIRNSVEPSDAAHKLDWVCCLPACLLAYWLACIMQEPH